MSNFWGRLTTSRHLLTVCFFALLLPAWIGSHLPAVFFGVNQTPLHVSYWTADEQSGVNGALHILKERSVLGLRNADVLYYGPVMGLVGVPAPALDFLSKYLSGSVRDADDYKDAVVWDWGGVLAWARLVTVAGAFVGLLGIYALFRTSTFNPALTWWLPCAATCVAAASYSYFIYSSFFRHWIFVVVVLIWQLYIATRIHEVNEKGRLRLWTLQAVLTAVTFGISHVGIMFQVFWLPLLIMWLGNGAWERVKEFAAYVFASLVGMALMIWWHPYAFERILGLVGLRDVPQRVAELDLTNNTTALASLEFYVQLIILAILPLLVMAAVLAFRARRSGERTNIMRSSIAWMLLLPAAVNLVVFSFPDLHVSRYVFPATLLLILFFMMYIGRSIAASSRVTVQRIALAFVGTFIVLNVVQNIGWLRMVSAGPPERATIVPQLYAIYEQKPNASVLILKGWPLGVVHTNAAYADFMTRYQKGKSELWQYLTTHEPPTDVVRLNAYYARDEQTFLSQKDAYDYAVRYSPPPVGKDVTPLSPTDEFEIRPWNVWRYSRFQERYDLLEP